MKLSHNVKVCKYVSLIHCCRFYYVYSSNFRFYFGTIFVNMFIELLTCCRFWKKIIFTFFMLQHSFRYSPTPDSIPHFFRSWKTIHIFLEIIFPLMQLKIIQQLWQTSLWYIDIQGVRDLTKLILTRNSL